MMSDEIETPETTSEEDINDSLKAAFDKLAEENVALKEQALRYAAEAENTKRRAEREANDARAFGIQRFATGLLGVADVLQRALSSVPADISDPAFKTFVDGIAMTERELAGAFDKNGVKRINPLKGDKFDPHLHQAVMEQPSAEVEGGSVLMVMQPGYELFGRVIRPAMVAVSARTGTASPPPKNGYDHGDGETAGEAVDTQAE